MNFMLKRIRFLLACQAAEVGSFVVLLESREASDPPNIFISSFNHVIMIKAPAFPSPNYHPNNNGGFFFLQVLG